MNERPHKKLEVYKKSIEMLKFVYEISKALPTDEKFGLVSLKVQLVDHQKNSGNFFISHLDQLVSWNHYLKFATNYSL